MAQSTTEYLVALHFPRGDSRLLTHPLTPNPMYLIKEATAAKQAAQQGIDEFEQHPAPIERVVVRRLYASPEEFKLGLVRA